MLTPVHSFRTGNLTGTMWLAFVLLFFAQAASGQQSLKDLPDLSRNPEWFPRVYKPYQAQKLPGIDLSNS